MLRFTVHIVLFIFLTLLTQIGGLAWLGAQAFKRRFLAFLLFYAALSFAAGFTAPHFGREPLSCTSSGSLQVQSWFYCALNRHYVSPEIAVVAKEAADAVAKRYPGTVTQVLDANFPFFDGFPLLPHLSHDDGTKLDLAFYYQDAKGYLPGATKSPIGYFAFEDGPTVCPAQRLSLRWDMQALQPL